MEALKANKSHVTSICHGKVIIDAMYSIYCTYSDCRVTPLSHPVNLEEHNTQMAVAARKDQRDNGFVHR